MEGTTVAYSNALRARSALVVSPDEALSAQLQQVLAEHGQAPIRTASSYREAEQFLRGWNPSAALIDLRRAAAGENPVPFLHQLNKQGPHRGPIIGISDAGYNCDWAALADLILSGHVSLPLDRRQLARLLAAPLSQGTGRVEITPLAPRVVHGETIAYKTYTPEMFPVLDDLLTVAGHDVTVLLVGETGTGKTTLARLIHELSPRRDARLLTVACGALPPELIESELFGHVRGAFTGADQNRQGKFEAAKDGTLLLDEIDVLGPGQQAKLLRVIETGEFEPVGSNETRLSGARLVVASNVDIQRLMEGNTFRADLYYRLSMMELRILPLRERPRDIVPLALDFIEEFCTQHNVLIRRVHPDFLACLKHYHWPGNLRELKNHVRRAVLFCRSGVLTPCELGRHFANVLEHPKPAPPENPPPAAPPLPVARTFVEKVARNEKEILLEALREHNNNRAATARTLGLSRVGLYKKMKRHGMLTPRPR